MTTDIQEPVATPADDAVEFEDDLEFLEEFITEWNDHLAQSETALLALEEDPADKEALNAIFRAFHSIKGGAGFVNLTALQKLAHRAENLLDRARNEEVTITGGFADLALEAADTLKQMIADIAANGPSDLVPDNYEGLVERLERPEEMGITADAATPAGAGAPAAAGAESGGGRAAAAQEATIRVQTDRLDGLINMVGELVVAHSMIERDTESAEAEDSRVTRNVALLGKITRDLQGLSMSMRMVPLRATFQKMKRLVRDLARKTDKQVDFVTEGEDTEIDRNVVELVADPLVHMIRNSMDHGLESPEERVAAGKPERGRLVLSARHADGNVVIEVKDDGRGIDPRKIHAKAVEKGIVADGREMSKREILNLVFAPGFSTAAEVTAISGRGVGMDVVRRNIESVQGRIDIDSDKGRGSSVAMRIPLTLAIIDGMLIKVGAENFIVPTLSVRQAFRPDRSALTTITERGEMVRLRDSMVPICRLARIFDVPDAREDITEGLLLLVEPGNGAHYALLVDELLGKQQAVIKSLGKAVGEVPGISGAAILGNGRVGLILDVGGIQQLTNHGAAGVGRLGEASF